MENTSANQQQQQQQQNYEPFCSEGSESEEAIYKKMSEKVSTYDEELDLQWIDLSNERYSKLCSCLNTRGLTNLTKIALGGCGLGDVGAPKVLLAMKSLMLPVRKVDLFFNQITSTGVVDITRILLSWREEGPTFLGLGWNDLGDDGLRELLPIIRSTSSSSIQFLSLANCVITQAGGLILADELTNSEKIRFISLKGNTDISKATLTAIQEKFPINTISW